MIIYNVTTKTDWSIAADWLLWMRTKHIPLVLGTGCFERHQLVKLLQTDESDGPVYAVQYFSVSMEKCEDYIQNFEPSLRKEVWEKWGDKLVDFSTLMQEVE